MGIIVSGFLVIVASFLTVPVTVFALEIIAGIMAARRNSLTEAGQQDHPPLAVLVPAHDESAGIRLTIEDIRKQMRPCDRLLVVADNCADDTAAVARAAGAEVVERNESAKRGKGFALDWGIRHLGQNPREIVIVIDADCRLANDALGNLARACARMDRPVQASYLMRTPAGSQVNYQVAEFAWRVKNWLRPLGLHALNLPSQLTGTGMAFPWEIIRLADLASTEIVEDMKLGLDLALAGRPSLFCPSALVTSEFASSAKGSGTQRKRWEQGHLTLIFKFAPRLFAAAVVRRDPKLLAITLDLTVPPLSLLGLLVLSTFGLSLSLAILNHSFAPLVITTANLLTLAIATILAWLKCGRDVVPIRALLLIPSYTFCKLKLYGQLALGRIDSHWTRTERAE
ncbi:cellulose synthase/poly-beta-1,6-N-acetylglucosamine synthase-like glycosyltransferase [Bradyrhizobium sp. F1.4.3]|uniref:glycosyltransferase family 2 protein n=1 Tax=Bradyrhizobium sp. F1.4.3 TaxID=3156356 RepID=UPI0033937845